MRATTREVTKVLDQAIRELETSVTQDRIYKRHTQHDMYQRRLARWLLQHRLGATARTTGRGDETEYIVGRTFVRAKTLDIFTPSMILR